MSIHTKTTFTFGLVVICLAGFCSASGTRTQEHKKSPPAVISSTPVLDAESVSVALASVMESRAVSPIIADNVNQPPIVSSTDGTEEEKGRISTGSNEQLTQQPTVQQQPQIELSSQSRTAADEIVREIVVLDKETGTKYKVITVKFPNEDDAAANKGADTTVQVPEKPEATVQSVDAEQKEQQKSKGDADAEAEEKEVAEQTKTTSDEKESVEEDKKSDVRQVEQSRKSEKKNDKKKNKEIIDKESEKKSTDKSNSKQDKKRSKRNVDEHKKSFKGKGKYSSKNRGQKKYKSKGK